MQIVRFIVFIAGMLLVADTLFSEIKTFVLPRSAPDPLTRFVFIYIRHLFNILLHRAKTYEDRDHIMAYYAPVSLLALVPVWLILVLAGYTAIFWAASAGTWDGAAWYHAVLLSGSALFTLSF